MAVEPQSGEHMRGETRPSSNDFQDRTFMGGIGLGTRSSLFVLMGIAVLVAGGFGLFFADKELGKADLTFIQATDLNIIATGVERDVWRIRAESGELSKRLAAKQFPSTDAEIAATQEHVALANALGQRLDEIYQRPDAALIGEHVSTLREAVAQYVEQYEASAKKENKPTSDMSGLEASLRQSIRDIGKILTTINILSINETMTAIRAATTEFIESGSKRDLAVIENHQMEFARLLTSIPITEETRSALQQGLDAFRTSFTAYAKVRLVRDNTRDRIEEIVSYMAPSVDAISRYAGDNLLQVQTQRAALRQRFRTLIASGIAGSMLLVILFGAAMLRSITDPLAVAAEAARNLSHGNTDIVVKGLANEDETGDVARAFWTLKKDLSEANELRDNLKKAQAEAERGHAASAETEWLRRDLESMKAETDKGKEAIAEVALLRKIIDATTDTIGQNQNVEGEDPAIVSGPSVPTTQAPGESAELALDSISSISRQVALSSENVTAAAAEAERTGTLIRNLSDASDKIDTIESLIAAIGEQADLLVVNAGPQSPDTNLVLLSGDGEKNDRGRLDGVSRRFDTIRSAAGQATWAVRDIGALIRESRNIALNIARLSSVEALEVTTDLLQQSENLRGMLDKLVDKMQDQIGDETTDEVGESDGPSLA